MENIFFAHGGGWRLLAMSGQQLCNVWRIRHHQRFPKIWLFLGQLHHKFQAKETLVALVSLLVRGSLSHRVRQRFRRTKPHPPLVQMWNTLNPGWGKGSFRQKPCHHTCPWFGHIKNICYTVFGTPYGPNFHPPPEYHQEPDTPIRSVIDFSRSLQQYLGVFAS